MEKVNYGEAQDVLKNIISSHEKILSEAKLEKSFYDSLSRKVEVLRWVCEELYRLEDLNR